MMQQLGEVKSGVGTAEFGKAFVERKNRRFNKRMVFDQKERVWMSHGDHVSKIAPGFEVLVSPNAPYAIVGDTKRHYYAVQFHPKFIILQMVKLYLKILSQ